MRPMPRPSVTPRMAATEGQSCSTPSGTPSGKRQIDDPSPHALAMPTTSVRRSRIAAARERPREGSRVRVERGPLAGLEGVVTRYLPARDRVRLLLAVIGGVRNVEVDARHVRAR